MSAPLEGVRILELAGGIAVPYAGRLLASLGATVVKVEPDGGDPARTKQIDDVPLSGVSPLYLHLNAAKQNVSAADRPPLSWADLVLADRVRSQVAATELDPVALASASGPLLVTSTAWGFDADEPGTIEDELLVQARSGCIAATGNEGRAPLRLAGWQSQYSAGATAAVAALAGLRMPGVHHIDVPWIAALQVGMELEFADRLHSGRSRAPSGPFPPAGFPGGALPCKDGFVCPGSYRDIDWEMQTLFYGMPELYSDERFSSRAARATRVDELWEIIRPWYAEHTKAEIFQFCLDSPWTVGTVMTGIDALGDAHLAERGLLGPVETEDGTVTAPVRPFRTAGLPVPNQRVEATGATGRPADADTPPSPVTRKPLDGLRVLEFAVAWAGPFAGNMLGALGADVIRMEAVRPFEGYRLLRLHGDSDPEHLLSHKNSRNWLEVSALFNAVNRNKRGLTLDVSAEQGQEVFKDLVANVDVVLCNFTARVMPQLGFDFETLERINPGIVVVRMPAFGTVGPYSHCAGYALIVEAMGGMAARWGYDDEGARVSDTYWPDSVAGTHAAVAVLSGIERRDRTGKGSEIDLSHQDVMWHQVGEGLVAASQRGADVGRMENREPGVGGSGIEPATDGDGWEAVVGDRRERVVDVVGAAADARLQYRFETFERPIVGTLREIRTPMLVNGQPVDTKRPAPLFDQHSDEVLTEVGGYDDARIAELRAAKIVGGELPDPRGATW